MSKEIAEGLAIKDAKIALASAKAYRDFLEEDVEVLTKKLNDAEALLDAVKELINSAEGLLDIDENITTE